MSDNANESEQQQQMQELFICADVLLGAFAFLDPLEQMALISDRLDVLVVVHFKSRKWSLGLLRIGYATDGNGVEWDERSYKLLPIPQEPLPDKVFGFESISICYVDQTVIEFLQRIRRLFDSFGTTVAIYTDDDQSRSWEIICQKIWPFVNDNIRGLRLLFPTQLDHLRQFSPAILYNAAASSHQAVAKWLLTPRGDGLPKMLYCGRYSEGMDGLKRSFVNASESANFIINFWTDEDDVHVIEPFDLVNNLTVEQLTLRWLDKEEWLLVRCPIGREEDKWTNWEKEAIEWDWFFQWNRIAINFEDCDIGDGMDETNEGPNEPAE
uniref:FBA_3 domain-containing protein n=1 Tax=Globodera pallida TaxID=36090 RepID=A0A183C678_GLOPA